MSIDQSRVAEIIRNADLYDLMRISIQSSTGRLKHIDDFLSSSHNEPSVLRSQANFTQDEVKRAVYLIEN